MDLLLVYVGRSWQTLESNVQTGILGQAGTDAATISNILSPM